MQYSEKKNKNKKPRILYLVTEDWYFFSHRLPISRAARDAGFEVIVATRVQNHRKEIEDEDFGLVPIRLRRLSKNPFYEILAIAELFKIYRQVHADIVHHISMKPVIYGSLAARFAGIAATVNTLAGMGYIFSSYHWRAKLLKPIIKAALKFLLNTQHSKLILQNPDDLETMVKNGIAPGKTALIKGSGVDIRLFSPMPDPPGTPVIVLASRMLWDKGIKEFVEAAGYIKKNYVEARFVLVGTIDPENPASIPLSQLEAWHSSGVVEWWGYRENMIEVFALSSIVCLPSTYGEGVPKVLIEAASCSRPIVTTDMPGCREIVRHGENGLLVPPRDVKALREALQKLVADPQLRIRMGMRGREITVNEFSNEKVVAETLAVYRELLPQ